MEKLKSGRTITAQSWTIIYVISTVILLCTACESNKPYRIELMPAPQVYVNGVVDPFLAIESVVGENLVDWGILYATDRKPVEKKELFYENQRGFILRLGLARVAHGENKLDWEEARRISLLKNPTEKYPLEVVALEEFGILDRSVNELIDPELLPSDLRAPAETYAGLINEKLEISRLKEILIYVHGYKVVFDNPILVTTELWHFLGYDGVAIAFAWPSTPSTWAYMSDLETAALSAHNLRVFIEFLAEETKAERINIIGYSAGTRVVIDALNQLSLIYAGLAKAALQRKFPVGQVILVGSDYDRDLFAAALLNGLLDVPDRLTIYRSQADRALGVSRWIFGRNRLGQMEKTRLKKPHVTEYLRRNDTLVFIDVTNAEAATAGNGHAYFRNSPWVSSDIFISLLYHLGPGERGLVQFPDLPVWHFPADYNQSLQKLLKENIPGFREGKES